MESRGKYLLDRYYDIDNDVKGNFNKLALNQFTKGSIEYADNTLFMMRCALLRGMFRFVNEKFSDVLNIYTANSDLTGQFFTLMTYGVACRDDNNITEATRILNKAYKISYELNDYNLILCGFMNFIFLDEYLGQSDKVVNIFGDAKKYLQHVTHNKIIGAYHLNYGYMLFSNGHCNQAMEHYKNALSAYSKFYTNKEAGNILAVRSNIAQLKLSLKDYETAINMYKELYQVVKRTDDNNIAYECLLGLVEAYKSLEDYKNAFEYLEIVNKKISQFKDHNNKIDSVALGEYLSIGLDETKDNIILANLELKKKTLELDENIKQLYMIAKIGKKVTLARNEKDLFDLMIDTIYTNIDYDLMGLFLVNSDERTINVKYITYKDKIKAYSAQVSFDSQRDFSAYCARNKTDILIDDLRMQYPDYIDLDPSDVEDDDDGSRIYCRLLEGNELIGVLTLQSYEKGKYDEQLFQTIKSISSYVAIALSNINKTKLLEEKTQKLEELSYSDALTGLGNRRSFIEYSDFLKNNPDSYDSVSLVIADMNHLKLINDNLGHLQGDKYLLEVSKVLLEISDKYKVYRLSGDEFGLFILGFSEDEVLAFITKVKATCAARAYHPYPLSLAIGYARSSVFDENKLFSDAEQNMYADKARYYDTNGFVRRGGI